MALSFSGLVLVGTKGKDTVQVSAQSVQHSAVKLSTKAVARSVRLVVLYEQLNGGRGGIYTKGTEGGYAWTDSENTQKLNYEWTFNSSSFDQFYLKATTGYELRNIYSTYDESENSFSGTTLETSLEGQTYTASLGDTTETTFYVVFTKKRLTVSIENDTLCRVSGEGTYLYGSAVTINFLNDSNNYQFVKWVKVLGDAEEDFSNFQTYLFEITESCVLKVKSKYLVNIPSNEYGAVQIEVDNVAVQERYFEPNTQLKITAIPNIGYSFVNWSIAEFFNKEISFDWTLTGPISFDAVFESKRIGVSISTNDSDHCSLENSTAVQGVLFTIGDTITIDAVINSLYALQNIQTNASEELDTNLISQNYIVTAQDVEKDELYFIVNVYKKLSEISLVISGSGSVKIGESTYSTNQMLQLSSIENYNLVMTAQSMFESEKVIYSHNDIVDEWNLSSDSLTRKFSQDGTLNVVFRHKLWYDEKEEFEGYGTKNSPYLIKNPQNLAYMAYVINNHITPTNPNCVNYNQARYKVMNDLDLDGRFWILIGANDNVEFDGVVDINYKTIENVYVVSNYGRYASFAKLFTEKNGVTLKLEHDLATLWINIGIYSSIFFGVALLVVVAFSVFTNQKAKKVVVLSEEVIDKKS